MTDTITSKENTKIEIPENESGNPAPPLGGTSPAGSGVTKRQVGQMIRQAFKRREDIKVFVSPPVLEDLKEGQEVEVDLHPAQIGPGEPIGFERRRYVRRGDQLFFHMLQEVR